MNLAQTDPYYIPVASDEGRLYLTRTVGSFSGGTRVKLVSGGPRDNWQELVVSAQTRNKDRTGVVRVKDNEITVHNEDLVIRRRFNR